MKSPRYPIFLLFMIFPAVLPVSATVFTWDGSNGSAWNTAANWNTALVLPLTDDELVFPAAASNKTNSNTTGNPLAVNRISFNGEGYSVSGGRIDLSSTVGTPLIRATYASGSSAVNLDVSLLQNATISTAAGGTLEFSAFGAATGNISLDSYTLTLTSAGTLNMGSSINGSGRVILSGAGTVRYTVPQTYTGSTAVNAGTLVVNDTLAGNTLSGALNTTLAGIGSINSTTTTNSKIAPGDGGRGRLTFLRGLSVDSPTALSLELGPATNGGTTYDQLRCQSTVSVLGNLELIPVVNFNPVLGTVYTLINKTSVGAISGTFGNAPQGGGLIVGGKYLTISYIGGDGNDLTATFTGSPPVISVIPNETFNEDSHTGGFRFTVTDADTPLSGITLRAVSGNPDLIDSVDGVFLSGPTDMPTIIVGSLPDANGTATITVTADDGSNTVSRSFLVTVTALNDNPSFVAGPDQNVAADAGPQTVPGWATSIKSGPPNEAEQTVVFDVVGNTNPTLFSVAPAISPAGVLAYTPAPGMTGSSVISLRLMDNGGVYQPGSGSGNQAASFTITVAPAAAPVRPQVVSFSSQPEGSGGRRILMSVAGGAALANRSALLQVSPDLEVWSTLTTGMTDAAGAVNFNTVDTAGGLRRYYRTKLP